MRFLGMLPPVFIPAVITAESITGAGDAIAHLALGKGFTVGAVLHLPRGYPDRRAGACPPVRVREHCANSVVADFSQMLKWPQVRPAVIAIDHDAFLKSFNHNVITPR